MQYPSSPATDQIATSKASMQLRKRKPPPRERLCLEIPSVASEAVEQDKMGRRLGGQLCDAARCGMQPSLQRPEGEMLVDKDDQLSIEGGAGMHRRFDARDDVGEITPERLARLGVEYDAASSHLRNSAKTVPLGSYCQPSPSGSCSASRASMGAIGVSAITSSDHLDRFGPWRRHARHAAADLLLAIGRHRPTP